MELNHIEKALERSRGERGARRSAAARETPAAPAPAPAGPGDGIRYTHTRVVTPSPATLARHRVLTGEGRDPATNAYKVLRTQVLQRMKLRGWNALAVTSPGPGEGKTLTAVNLAMSLAREVNHTVLLVDLDLRRPNVHACFGHRPAAGIVDHLLNDVPLSEVLFNPGFERLVVIPGGPPVAGSSELLSSPRMVHLVEELKTRYPSRLVIFDMSPVLSADDVLAFAPYLDAVLIVVEEGRTRRDDVERTLELLAPVNVLGCVLNRASEAGANGYY